MRSRIGTVLARHGIPGKLFGTIRGGGALVGGLAHALKGSVSAGAVLAGGLTLGGGAFPDAPTGSAYLVDNSGNYRVDSNGAYLIGAA